MSQELQVQVDRLRETARFVSDRAQTIRDRLKALDDTIGKELLADGWQGRAASAYDESWLEWKAGADQVVEALFESSNKLVEAANAYQMQDEANRDRIAGAHGHL